MVDFNREQILPVLDRYRAAGRTALLPVLHEVQDLIGYLPSEATAEVATALGVPLVDVFGVIDFYALFYREPVAKTVVHVCNDPICAMKGAESVYKRTTRKVELVNLAGDHMTETVTIERSPCLGLCEHAPTMLIKGAAVADTSTLTLEQLLSGFGKPPQPIIGGYISILTQNCECGSTTWLKEYEEIGGYQALRKAFAMQPIDVIAEVKTSGLLGRGGAAFPTGVKWESTARAPGSPKYIVCNADEAEPGTFKDRTMMEFVPHRLLEGIIIGAYAIGANKGYIYIRGEYRRQIQIMQHAIEEAREAGYLGDHILNSPFSLDLEIRRGAGAYICGEETAQFESIEGKRGFPRIKPPFPTTHGLFGKPTVINNVETFCNIPIIVGMGAQDYRKIGTEGSPGPKLFCVSGDVVRPGLYEVPFGITFRHLLEDLAGGIRDGHRFQAALFGGAAGKFISPDLLDIQLSFEGMRPLGIPLGAGAIMIFDETRDLRDILLRLGHFFMEESCGKCYPCQIGTQRQYEILQRIYDRNTLPNDATRLTDVAACMTDSSLCGLGQTASMAVMSAMNLWPDLFKTAQ